VLGSVVESCGSEKTTVSVTSYYRALFSYSVLCKKKIFLGKKVVGRCGCGKYNKKKQVRRYERKRREKKTKIKEKSKFKG
jgi:hypothetical protein